MEAGIFPSPETPDLDNKHAGPQSARTTKDTKVAKKSQNVQDVFLNHVRRAKTPVTVFLVNGVKLQGIITWFDNFSVLLRRDGHTQLVYKHAISTVMPGRADPIVRRHQGRGRGRGPRQSAVQGAISSAGGAA